MKSKIIAIALFLASAAAVVFYPMAQTNGAGVKPVVAANTQQKPRVEAVFVLDTTGSMGGLIQAAKEKIWSIATTMAQADPAPEIKIGLVAYRDRGDAYVTRVVDLSADLDSLYATLMDFAAEGGGDGPESVNQALHDAVRKISWGQDPQAYKVIFLVGDAPAHMDYQNDVKYPDTIAIAKQKGIVVNAIQCGQDGMTTPEWQRIAQLGGGRFFEVGQAGSAVAIATPFDEKLATLSKELDSTRLYYGKGEMKAKQQRKLDSTEKLHGASSIESRARRAAFNASKSGGTNLLGENELVDDVASGRVDLSTIERDALPEPMRAMAPAAQQAVIQEKAGRRNELKGQIKELAAKRSAYLKKKVEETDGAKDSLDQKIYDTVREQAGGKGMDYKAGALAY